VASIRFECGLEDPSDIFTTNPSETINALLKHKVEYKRSELPVFIEKVKELVEEQNREVECAVINRGKYQLRKQFKFLEITESKWFSMNQQQRSQHLSKVHSYAIQEGRQTATCSSVIELQIRSSLSLSAEEASESLSKLNIPLTCIVGVWRKTTDLLMNKDAIAPAPGHTLEARMVLSYSGKSPHLVTPNKGGGFSCDEKCVNWKSIGIGSHTVAVAEINNKLPQFLTFLTKQKKTPNVTALVTSSMPSGRGRKGCVAPRKRKPKDHPVIEERLPMSSTSAPTSITPPPPPPPPSVQTSITPLQPTTSFATSSYPPSYPPISLPFVPPSCFAPSAPSPITKPPSLSVSTDTNASKSVTVPVGLYKRQHIYLYWLSKPLPKVSKTTTRSLY
jgi:hypothetical protein